MQIMLTSIMGALTGGGAADLSSVSTHLFATYLSAIFIVKLVYHI